MGRTLLAAICGLVLIGGAVGASKPNPQADAQSQQPQKTAQDGGPKSEAKDEQRSEALTYACHKRGENRYSDLCAQWKAADSAEQGAVWAKWTGIFTGLGLGIGAITTIAAIAAAIFAAIASHHTKDGARAAWAAVRSNRAWILPAGMDTGIGTNVLHEDGNLIANGIVFIPKIANRGGSPALRVGVTRDFAIVAADALVPDFPRLEPIAYSILSPGEVVSAQKVFLTDAESAAFRAGQTVFYLKISTDYRDIYSEDDVRKSEFVYVARHNGGQMRRNGEVVEAIDVTYADVDQILT